MKSNTPLNVYILAGKEKTGKTDTIRGITNRWNGVFTQITEISGNKIDFYFRTQSLQEAKISPQDFQNKIKRKKRNFSSILIALRTDPVSKDMSLPYNKLADHYIDYFINICKWNVVFVAELSSGQFLQYNSLQYKYKYQSFSWQNSVNQLIGLVKNFFNFK